MAVWDKTTLWGFLFLLAGSVGQTVIYEEPACAVRGSTVTLPCSFEPPKSFSQRGSDRPLVIIRVLWYQSQWHQHCHLTKPFVYDSDSKIKKRFEYLGDKKTNCTLQIRDVQERDEATFCFRMEINHTEVHFTESRGVTVRVVDGTKMRIISSSEDKKFSRGETVTLLCTSLCTFHQLDVAWFRDGHALSESGPFLQVDPLTAEDSGNYTCALKTSNNTLSEPYSLQVEAEEGVKLDKLTAVRLVLFAAHTLLFIIVASVIIKGHVCRLGAGQQQKAERHLEASTLHSGAENQQRRTRPSPPSPVIYLL